MLVVPLIVLIGASVGGLLLLGTLCVIAMTCVVRGRNNANQNPKENFKSRELLPLCRLHLLVISLCYPLSLVLATYTPTTPVTVDLRPPIAIQLHGQDTFEIYDNCVTYEAVDEEQQTTFTPLQQEEALYEPRQEVATPSEATRQEEEEEVEEERAAMPDNDTAIYEAMVVEAGVDDDYEELTTPAYDVPRRAICEGPAYNNVGGNSNIGCEGPAYNNMGGNSNIGCEGPAYNNMGGNSNIGCEGPAYNNMGGNSNNGRPTVLYSPMSTSRLV